MHNVFTPGRTFWSRKHLFPWLLMAPQLVITLVFFIWPALQAVRQSFYRESPFGLSSHFAGIRNYAALFTSADYLRSIGVTFTSGFAITLLAMVTALLLALAANSLLRKRLRFFNSVFIWPYAISPAVAGLLWMFLLNPVAGVLARLLAQAGISWNSFTSGADALSLIIVAGAWKQISYNFVFFLAALQSVPLSLHEAAAIDGAGPVRRFFHITFPLLSPVSFFLLIVNLIYAFCDTFSIIDAVTKGGPGNATMTMVYKIFADGFRGISYGSSSAQSVLLMILVIVLVLVQFRLMDRKVVYSGG